MGGKNKKKEVPVQRGSVQNKKFEYAKNNINLDFTLRTDVKNELQDFLDILAVATEDVKKELEGIQ